MANEKFSPFPQMCGPHIPQYVKAFRRVAPCFIFLLGFSRVFRQSSFHTLDSQYVQGLKHSDLLVPNDHSWARFCVYPMTFQDVDNRFRGNSKRCAVRRRCPRGHRTQLGIYDHV